MADDDDSARGNRPDDIGSREQDPYVAAVRPTPADSATPGRTFVGFLGDSDLPGRRRLYFDRGLMSYAEFDAGDVADSRPIPPEQPPFVGDRATRVTFRPGARLELARTVTTDDFDLAPLPPAASAGTNFFPEVSGEWCWGSRKWWCPWYPVPPYGPDAPYPLDPVLPPVPGPPSRRACPF